MFIKKLVLKCTLRNLYLRPFRESGRSESCTSKRSSQSAIAGGFNVKYEKSIGMVSAYSLYLICEKLPLVKYWCCIIEEYLQLSVKFLKYVSLFQLHICMRPRFLHLLEPKQRIEGRNSYQNAAVFY